MIDEMLDEATLEKLAALGYVKKIVTKRSVLRVTERGAEMFEDSDESPDGIILKEPWASMPVEEIQQYIEEHYSLER